MNRLIIILLLTVMLPLQHIAAQDDKNSDGNDGPSPAELMQLSEHIYNTMYDISSLSGRVASAQSAQLEMIERMVNQLDIRWQIWYQAKQADISKDDSLMTLAANFEITKKMLMDSIASRRKVIQSVSIFRKAEKSILEKDSVYSRMVKEAKLYSLTPTTQQQLAKLKMREQLFMKDIDSSYTSAKEAAGVNKHLAGKMAILEDHYVSIKAMSESIQSAQYQSFLQRWKEQLIGLAIFAVIGVLVTSLATRLKSAKDAKKAQKKMEELMKKESEEYPTI